MDSHFYFRIQSVTICLGWNKMIMWNYAATVKQFFLDWRIYYIVPSLSLTQPRLGFALSYQPPTDTVIHKKMDHFDHENEDNAEWLLHILKQVQLEQFYVRIRDHLQISRISHFDYVTPDDLEKVRTKSISLRDLSFNQFQKFK